ncbi:hypothetical protein HanRHA438_Chr14g0645411 [Helianthus annuus]|nr:hypothetical protein HanRHA438_Chr14g0645411 [Helianthus annuus]
MACWRLPWSTGFQKTSPKPGYKYGIWFGLRKTHHSKTLSLSR